MLLVILTLHIIMLINFYKLCSCKVHHSNHYHSSNKSFDLCVLCVVPTSWAVTSQGRTLLVVQVNEPPALSPQLQMFSGERTPLSAHSASLCSASGYMVFLQENYLYCGDFLELQVSTLLQTPWDVWFYLPRRRWDCWVSVIQTLQCQQGRQLDVAVLWPPGRGSGDQWPTIARADWALENSGYGESIPVSVHGGSANDKPEKTLGFEYSFDYRHVSFSCNRLPAWKFMIQNGVLLFLRLRILIHSIDRCKLEIYFIL